MYESFFGLAERPFDLTPNPKYLVLTEAHREVLSNLEYAISSRKGITLLLGEAGSGKTTLIRAAMEKQPVRVHCVHLQNPTLTREEFVETLAVRFNLSDRACRSKAAFLAELEGQLAERSRQGETTVLIVDEAQSLPSELLEEIRLLANIETASDKLLTVILAGQPELADRLNHASLRQLKQRVALRCELRALSREEAVSYVAGRIRIAGGVGAQVFTREAVELMHVSSRGIPRTISVIADNALVGGFAAGVRPVPSRFVREVSADFDLAVPVKGQVTPPQTPASSTAPAGPAPVKTTSPSQVAQGAANALLQVPAREAAAGTGADSTNDQSILGTLAPRRKRYSFFWS
jgi:type II secretory pathway predicted ATPase ExeA